MIIISRRAVGRIAVFNNHQSPGRLYELASTVQWALAEPVAANACCPVIGIG